MPKGTGTLPQGTAGKKATNAASLVQSDSKLKGANPARGMRVGQTKNVADMNK